MLQNKEQSKDNLEAQIIIKKGYIRRCIYYFLHSNNFPYPHVVNFYVSLLYLRTNPQ